MYISHMQDELTSYDPARAEKDLCCISWSYRPNVEQFHPPELFQRGL